MKVLAKDWKEGRNLGIGKSNSDFSFIAWPDSYETLTGRDNIVLFNDLNKEDQKNAFEKHFNILKNIFYSLENPFYDVNEVPPFLKQFILIENCINTTKPDTRLQEIINDLGFPVQPFTSTEHPINHIETFELIYDISFYDNILTTSLPSFLYRNMPYNTYTKAFNSFKEIENYIYDLIVPQRGLLLELNNVYKVLVIYHFDFRPELGYLMKFKII